MAEMTFKIHTDYSELEKLEDKVAAIEKDIARLNNNPAQLKIKTDELSKAREELSALATQLLADGTKAISEIEKRIGELNELEPDFIHKLFGGHLSERKQLLSDLDDLSDKVAHAQEAYGKGKDNVYQAMVKQDAEKYSSANLDTNFGVQIPVYFKTEEAWQKFQELGDKIREYQTQIANYDGDNAGLEELKGKLDDTVNSYLTVQTEANKAANSFGSLSAEAVSVSNALYGQNEAVKSQQERVAELKQKHDELRDAMVAAAQSGDSAKTEEATAAYQNLNAEYEKSKVRLQEMQAEQEGLQRKYDETNRRIAEQSTLMVKLFGGGDLDTYKERLAGMPLVMREVVTWLQNMQVAMVMMQAKAQTAFTAAGGGVKGFGAALKALGLNPVGLAIMGVVAAVKLLTSWFKTSEKGQRTFAYLSAYIGAIMKKVADIGIVLMDALFDMFTSPTKAGKNFASVLVDAVGGSIKALFSPVAALGKLLKSIFDGSFSWDTIKTEINGVVDAYAKAGKNIKLLVQSTGDAVERGFGGGRFNKVLDFSDAGKIVRAALDERTAGLRMAIDKTTQQYDENGNKVSGGGLTYNEMAMRMRENQMKFRDNSLSAEERKKAIEQYKNDLAIITGIDRKFAQARADRQKLRNDFTTSSLEDLEAYQKELAGVAEVEMNAVAKQRPLIMAQNKLLSEEKKAQKAGEKSGIEAAKTAGYAEEAKMLENKQALELARLIRENQNLIEQNRIDAMEEGAAKSLAQLKLNQQKELDAVTEYEQKLKQKKIDDAKTLFKKRNPNGVFRADSVNLTLTEEEQRSVDERTLKANNVYASAARKLFDQFKTPGEKLEEQKRQYEENIEALEQIIREQEESNDTDERGLQILRERLKLLKAENPILKKQREERIAYLKTFGDLVQQEAAINEEYDQRRKEAVDSGASPYALDQIEAERTEAISKNRMEALKEEINWEEVFSNLDYVSTAHLKRLREQLRAALDMGDITAENARIIAEKLGEIDRQIQQKRTAWGQLFGGATQGVGGIVNAIRDQKALNADAAQKREAANKAQADATAATAAADAMLKLHGQDSEQYLKAQREADQKSDDAKKAGQAAEVAEGMAGGSALGATGAIIHGVNDNVQSFAEAAELLGGKDSGFAKDVAKFAESSQYATEGFEKFKSGDFIGAALSVGKAVSSLGETFGLWSNSNVEEMQEANEKLANAMAVNTAALDRLTKAMNEGSATQAYKKYEEALAVMQQNQNASAQTLSNLDSMYEDHHSTEYYFNQKKGQDIVRRMGNYLGQDWSNGHLNNVYWNTGLVNKLYETQEGRDLLKEFTQTLSDAESAAGMEANGIVGKFYEHLSNYSDEAYEELRSAFRQAVTGVSFDSFKDGFKSTLMDMEKSGKDFADTFTEQLTQSFLNTRIEEQFGGKLNDLYTAWSDALSDNNLSEAEVARLQRWQDDLTKEMMAERDRIAALTGYDDVSTSEASGSINAAKSMSEDTANELIGRMTAVQIAVERSGAAQGQMLASLEQELILARVRNEMQAHSNMTLESIQTILADSYLELRGINDNTSALVKPMQQMASGISEIRDKIQSL